jgi:broad specificity phosphatase PhoE
MTTRLYLVRHGATPLTTEDRFSGAANVHLSEEGRSQVGYRIQFGVK